MSEPSGPDGRVEAAFAQSRIVTAGSRALARFERASETALTVGPIDRLDGIVRRARTYRWVTRSPRGRTVVVDLSQSRLVGPVVPAVIATAEKFTVAWHVGSVRSGLHALTGLLRGAPVRAVSTAVLALVCLSVIAAWGRITPVGFGSAAILSGLAVLGLRDGRPWEDLRETWPGRVLLALVAPPDGRQR